MKTLSWKRLADTLLRHYGYVIFFIFIFIFWWWVGREEEGETQKKFDVNVIQFYKMVLAAAGREVSN